MACQFSMFRTGDEILQLTDRVAVLRDGELVATYRTSETDLNRIVRDMVGRALDQIYPTPGQANPGTSARTGAS